MMCFRCLYSAVFCVITCIILPTASAVIAADSDVLRGVIAAIEPGRLTVQTQTGETRTVVLPEDARIWQAARPEDVTLAKGARVVAYPDTVLRNPLAAFDAAPTDTAYVFRLVAEDRAETYPDLEEILHPYHADSVIRLRTVATGATRMMIAGKNFDYLVWYFTEPADTEDLLPGRAVEVRQSGDAVDVIVTPHRKTW